MTFADRVDALLRKKAPPANPYPIPPGSPPLLAEIQRDRAAADTAEMARGWLQHPFTRRYMALLEREADSLHAALLAGKISGETYSTAYNLLLSLRTAAQAALSEGDEAAKRITQWRDDGTLEQVDPYIAAQGRIEP